MSRAAFAFRAAAGLALILAWYAWWLPSILFMVARLAAEGARFFAVLAWSRALGAFGLHRTEMRLCEAERDRVAAKMATARDRR